MHLFKFFLVADSTVKRTTHNENASEFIVADSSVVTPSKNSSEFISLSEYPKLFIPKSLSVSDLTSDSMIMKEIRACSVPPSINFNVTPSENLQVDMDSQDRSSSHLHHSISDARIESESPSLLINLHSVTHLILQQQPIFQMRVILILFTVLPAHTHLRRHQVTRSLTTK